MKLVSSVLLVGIIVNYAVSAQPPPHPLLRIHLYQSAGELVQCSVHGTSLYLLPYRHLFPIYIANIVVLMGKRNIRMLVLGDGALHSESVGKTTLIQSLVSDTFPEDVPPVTNPIQVPLDGSNTDNIATIVDTACEG